MLVFVRVCMPMNGLIGMDMVMWPRMVIHGALTTGTACRAANCEPIQKSLCAKSHHGKNGEGEGQDVHFQDSMVMRF